MKAPLAGAVALLALALLAPSAPAQCCPVYIPQAPNTYGPCWYNVNYCGAVYGPNYNLHPPFLPFQGMVCAPNQGKKGPSNGGPRNGGPPGQGPGAAARGGAVMGEAPYAPGPAMAGGQMPDMFKTAEMQQRMGLHTLPGLRGPAHLPPVTPMPPIMGVPGAPPGPPQLYAHPYARSPRDFFMVD
jgi:hypothetical protein